MKKISLLIMFLMSITYGQQVIGSFPTMDGGFEGQTLGVLTGGSVSIGIQYSNWTTSSNTLGTIRNNYSRTGSKSVVFYTSSTTKRLQSPTAANGAIVNATAYTLQYYYRTNGATAPGGTPQFGVSPDGTNSPGSYVALTESGTSGGWTKVNASATSGSSANSPKYGVMVARWAIAMTDSIYIDDFCMYAGAVDNTAPDPITVPAFSSVAATQMTLGWTAPGTGTDGGGYMVVRGTADPTAVPNTNGIYAIGNLLAAGQQIVYLGTNPSFIDNGLSPSTHYYYRIYTVDKAFNYSSSVALDGSTTAPSYAAEPTVQASNITFANIAQTSFDINWTNSGNGSNHLVIVKSGIAVDANPVDGASYTSATTFGTGSLLGTGNYVVYNGTGSTVSISGLTKATKYYVSIFEFNGSGGSENYLLTSPPTANQSSLPGEIVSNGSNSAGVSWNTTGAWTGGVIPGAGDNVTVVSGDKIIVASSQACFNLTVNSGGKVYNNIALPTSSLTYLTVYGNTATIDGTLGDKITDGSADGALGINFNGNLTITGSGLIRPARIRPNTNAQNVTLTIDANTEAIYTGSTGNGGAGIYTDVSGNDNITITVNSGKTLSFVDGGNLNTASSSTTNGGANTIFNINGTLNIPGVTSNFSLPIASGKSCALNVGATGVVNIAHNLNATSASGGAIPTITNNGSITVGGTADFTGATYVGGSGSFILSSGAKINIGAAAGLDPVNGPIRTTTRSFNSGAAYSYVGTLAQATGSDLPSTIDGLTISNPLGVTLTGSNTVITALNLTGGLLTTGSGNVLTLGSAAVVTGGSATSFVNGPISITARTSSPMFAPIGKGSAYRPITANLTALSGSGTLTAEQMETPPLSTTVTAPGNPVLSGMRYFHIAQSGLTSATVDLTLSWGADDGVSDPSTLTIVGGSFNGDWHYAGEAPYISYLGTSSAGTVTVSSLPLIALASEDCALGSLGGNPLPVNLASFSAVPSNGAMKLSWKTAVETDNHGFNVERSADKSVWSTLTFIQGQGNSNSAKAYSYSDNSINKAGKYYYRLKQIDNNGGSKYSNLVEADYILPTVYSLNQNYPNPFNPNTIISYALPAASNVKISVYNAIGETVQILENGFKEAGNYTVSFNASNIPTGIYFYRIEAGTFSQVRKMMLLK